MRNLIRRIIIENLVFNPYRYNSFSELTEQDLYDIAKWGLEGEYSSSGCWDDNDNIDDAAKCAVGDFKMYLNKSYPIELGNVPNAPIIYRIVRLKDVAQLNRSNLGKSWFSNPEQYKNSEFFDMLDYLKRHNTEEGETYLIKGQTSIDNIDVPRTLWERSTQWWENEIVVKDDSKIKLISHKKMSELA